MRPHHRQIAYRPPRDEHEREGGSFRLYLRFLRQYMLPVRRPLLVCIVLVSLNACSVYLMGYYGRVVVDQILGVAPDSAGETAAPEGPSTPARGDLRPASHPPPEHGGVAERTRDAQAPLHLPGAGGRLMVMFFLYTATIVILNVATRAAQRIRIRVSQTLTGTLRENMHEKLLGLSRTYHLRHTPGRLMARILSDVNVLQSQMISTVLDTGQHVIMFFVGFGLLASIDWAVALLAVACMVPYAVLYRWSITRITPINTELRHTNACLYGLVSQKLDAVRAILAYSRERHERLSFHRLCSCFLRDLLAQERMGAILNSAVSIISAMATSGVFLYGARLVLDGRMGLGQMLYMYSITANLFTPVVGLTQMTVVMTNLLVVLQRVTHILEEPLKIREAEGAVDFPAPVRSGIRIRRLTFRYDDDTPPVLRNLNLDVPAGQWLCVMGPSGSGKSTFLHLLCRLYDPTQGEVRYDGIPLLGIRFVSLRERVALVPQEAQIFSGTVRDNITYGEPDALPARIMAAARAADCHDFIMALPVQYETTIGEKGASLSGGQRQRISIARALLSEPEVLLLDDCTSALDADTERRIQETLARLLAGKTAVIVSQRVSMAMRCHSICIIEDGLVTEFGSHSQLMNAGGYYARLHAKQTE